MVIFMLQLNCSQYFSVMLATIGAIAVSSGAFGDDVGSAVLYSAGCSGIETGILSCSLSYSGTCSQHSAAVICQGKCKCIFAILDSLNCTDRATEPSNCTDEEMRLSGAITSNQGRLEVCMNGAWGSVCDSQGVFTTDEAKVACRQLGKLQVEGIYKADNRNGSKIQFISYFR